MFVALLDVLERFVQDVTGSVFEYPDKNLASKEMSEPNPLVLICLILSLIKRQCKKFEHQEDGHQLPENLQRHLHHDKSESELEHWQQENRQL